MDKKTLLILGGYILGETDTLQEGHRSAKRDHQADGRDRRTDSKMAD